jgi:S-formylglutathione hydrolase
MDATIRMQEGYDHSYFFVSTFIADHVRWHAEKLME